MSVDATNWSAEHLRLVEWVKRAEANGIKQHSAEWHAARVCTVGGSSLATITGNNPFSTVQKMISEKVGLTKFSGDIKPQWGNLFEDVIKRYVEADLRCEILGEDLFIEGPPGTSYSPDGLAVLARDGTTPAITLIEFKCPFVRIPNGSVPHHYMPQLLMGLDVLGADLSNDDGPCEAADATAGCAHGAITDRAMFVEAVFRRSAWEDCGPSPVYNPDLVKRTGTKVGAPYPLAFGINGFYAPNGTDVSADLIAQFCEFFCELGDATNDYQSADLGEAPVELFTNIMAAYDRGQLRAWYGPVRMPQRDIKGVLLPNAHLPLIEEDLDSFDEFCTAGAHTNWGILPWKLFRVDYHHVTREPRYLAPHIPKIREILNVVAAARAQPARAHNICDAYASRSLGGFSDD